MRKIFTTILTAGALTLSGNNIVIANEAKQDTSKSVKEEKRPARAKLKKDSASNTLYSDKEVLELLLAAQGPIADKNPDIVKTLGFSEEKPETDPVALDKVIDEYLAETPEFNSKVSKPFQSGDPEQVDGALQYLTKTFQPYAERKKEEQERILAEQHTQNGNIAEANQDFAEGGGWTWMGAYVAAYANVAAVANAVVYANAALATLAVATLAVVTWYLPEGDGVAQIDREKRIAVLTKAAHAQGDSY